MNNINFKKEMKILDFDNDDYDNHNKLKFKKI